MRTVRWILCICALAACAGIVGSELLSLKQSPRIVVRPSVAVVKARPIVTTTLNFAVPVLMYHRISDLSAKEARSPLMRDLTVSPSDFEAQVKHLAESGFTFLLAGEVEAALRDGTPLPEKSVAITMDDGYWDNFSEAYPILKKYGARATLFLVTNTVGTPGHVSWEEARQMLADAAGFGSHTVNHYELPSLPVEQMDFELRESKRVLEERLAETITSVAYPSGKYNRLVADRTKAAGYLAGWKKGGGPVEPGDDPYLLPRVRVNGDTTMKEFMRKIRSNIHGDRA